MNIFWEYFNQYGIYIIFLFIILEYSCFPVPSEVILPLAGAYAVFNNLNVFIIIIISIICGLIGSTICYLIGYGGRNIIIKKIIRKQNNEFNNSVINYNKYKNLSVCLCRIIPLCRTYISFVSGLNKHNLISFLFFSFIGITIWNTTLILLGYNLFDNLTLIESFYNKYKLILIVIFFVIILLFIIYKLIKKKLKR